MIYTYNSRVTVLKSPEALSDDWFIALVSYVSRMPILARQTTVRKIL